MNEKSPPGWSGTVKAMKGHPEIDNPFALAHSMRKKGYKAHYEPEKDEAIERLIDLAVDEINRGNEMYRLTRSKWGSIAKPYASHTGLSIAGTQSGLAPTGTTDTRLSRRTMKRVQQSTTRQRKAMHL